MKKFMMSLSCIFTISLLNAGVATDTVVETSEGPKKNQCSKGWWQSNLFRPKFSA